MPTMSSNRWAQVNLDPQIEHDAALVTVESVSYTHLTLPTT